MSLVFSHQRFFDDPVVQQTAKFCPDLLTFAYCIKDGAKVIPHPQKNYDGELYDPESGMSVHRNWCDEVVDPIVPN